jgi:anaerobic selenocysteine-containing dehydrogenase
MTASFHEGNGGIVELGTMTSAHQTPAKISPSRPRRRDAVAPPYARLTQPYVREHGKLRPASWEEALDRTAHAFRETVARRGPQAAGLFSCSKATN